MFPPVEPILELTKQQYIDTLIANDRLQGFITLTLGLDDAFYIMDAGSPAKERTRVVRSSIVHGEWVVRLHLRWNDIVVVRRGKQSTTPDLSFFYYDGSELVPTTPRRIDCPVSNMYHSTSLTGASWSYMGICARLFANEVRDVGYLLEHAHIPSVRISREEPEDPNKAPKSKWKHLLKGLEYWIKIDENLDINIYPASEPTRPSGYDGSVYIGYKHSQILFCVATEERVEKLWSAIKTRLSAINEGRYIFTENKEKLSIRAYLTPKVADYIKITDL